MGEHSSMHSTASTILGGSVFQEGSRLAKNELGRCSQEGSTNNGTHLGRGEAAAVSRQEWCQNVA